jgi:tetratricopeptide (TPR) repeat protein
LLYIYKFSTDLVVQNIFLFPFSGKPLYPDYAAYSARHLSDILNLFLLVYPVGLVTLAVSGKGGWTRILAPTTVYLGLLAVGSLLFLLLVDPGLSMPRDWDLFCSCWIAPMLLILHLLPGSCLTSLKRLAPSLVLSSVLLVLPWLMANLDTDRSIEEAKQIIDTNRDKSFGTISLLKFWYQTEGDTVRADSVEQVRAARYAWFYIGRQAWADLETGNLDLAEREFRSVPSDRYSREYHQFLAELEMRRQQYDSALYHAEMETRLAPYYDQGYTTLSSVYYCRHEPDKAMAALREGLSLNSESVSLTVGLAANFATFGQFDSTNYYGLRAIELDSTAVQPYFYLAQANDGLGDRRRALVYARKFISLGAGSAAHSGYRKQIEEEFPELDSAGVGTVDSTRR